MQNFKYLGQKTKILIQTLRAELNFDSWLSTFEAIIATETLQEPIKPYL